MSQGNGRQDGKVTVFSFGEFLAKDLNQSPWVVFFALLTLSFFIWFVVPFTAADSPTAYLTEALNTGLQRNWWTTQCFDEKCVSGQTWRKVFHDNIGVEDWRVWVLSVIDPQLFRHRRLNLTNPAEFSHPNAVAFDPRIVRTSPLYIRQLRGAQKPCYDLPTTPLDFAEFSARVTSLRAQECFHGNAVTAGWEKQDLNLSAIANGLLGPSALKFQEECGDHKPTIYRGWLGNYPCSGYVAVINNSAQLREAVDASTGWIDGSTRLISVSANFRMEDGAEVQYVLLQELGDNGESARADERSFPVSRFNLFSLCQPQMILFQVLLGGQLLFYVGRMAWYLYTTKVKKEIDRQRPAFLTKRLILSISALVIAYIGWDGDDRQALIIVIMIGYLQITLAHQVVFPAASMLSRDVKLLMDTLALAALHCMYVFPFLTMVYTAFIFSGTILFGRGAEDYSLLQHSTETVILGTFDISDEVWDSDAIEDFRPILANLFTFLFFASVLVVLSNMFLAMVTSASEEAQVTAPSIEIAENVLYYYRRRPMYGIWVTAFLALNVRLVELKRKLTPGQRAWLPRILRGRRSRDPVILTTWGRLWFPCECLVPRIQPMQITFLLKLFNHDRLNAYAYGALIPFVLQHFFAYKRSHPIQFAADELDNAEASTAFVEYLATAYYQQRVEDHLQQQAEPDEERDGTSSNRDALASDAVVPF